MHNVEIRSSKQRKKHSRSKPTKPNKACLKVLKNYKVLRISGNSSILPVSEPKNSQAFDTFSIPKATHAFLEASKRKSQTWTVSPPALKINSDGIEDEKDFNEENVYCNCRRPYCPGELMFKCEGFCEGWYHPECLKMKPEEVERQKISNERWYCLYCIDQAQRIVVDTSENAFRKIKAK